MKAFYQSSMIAVEILQASKRKTPYKISRRTSLVEEFAVQCPVYNFPENWLHRKYFVWVFRFFKIARRASLEESLFSKVIGEVSTLYTSVKNPFVCTRVFQKVVLLEISRNLQFAALTPNNFHKCLDWSL